LEAFSGRSEADNDEESGPEMREAKPQGVLRYLLHVPVWLYRWNLGWLLGHRFLLLVHSGRRTGRRHETVLEVMQYRKVVREAVVMSGFGRSSDWLLNIQAEPDFEVIIGAHRYKAQYRLLGEAEAAQVFREYERKNHLMYPILRYVLSRLLNWQYHGSDADVRNLVSQLPLIAFRPAAAVSA
jgi:deazaflavin-dependent oxidoreductase (nitroreductase family)